MLPLLIDVTLVPTATFASLMKGLLAPIADWMALLLGAVGLAETVPATAASFSMLFGLFGVADDAVTLRST